ncbi:hypothetical protein [Actinoplanes sp. NPDC026619]|uniref:hypothetical protein n=1 Tax=Actinoplanes sp. NPDC026619 TaxID=3155798 RepID=UPI0033D2C874
MSDGMLSAAVRNNAEWCALVCRTHGVESRFEERVWRALGPPPPFYPSAITLAPSASAADVGPAGASVKDSYATLDLDPEGFRPLFEAQWIHRAAAAPVISGPRASRVSDPATLGDWDAAWGGGDIFRPALLDDPDVAVLALHAGDTIRGGAILNRAGGVLGVSNLFGDDDDVWAAVIVAAGELFPGLDLVGYEQGDDLVPALAAGFHPIGPLRVWIA